MLCIYLVHGFSNRQMKKIKSDVIEAILLFACFLPIVVTFYLQFSCTMTLFDSIQIYEEQFKCATQSSPDIMFLKRYLTGP
jgi:hypothetical protein